MKVFIAASICRAEPLPSSAWSAFFGVGDKVRTCASQHDSKTRAWSGAESRDDEIAKEKDAVEGSVSGTSDSGASLGDTSLARRLKGDDWTSRV